MKFEIKTCVIFSSKNRMFHKVAFLVFRRPKMIGRKNTVLILAVKFKTEFKLYFSYFLKGDNFLPKNMPLCISYQSGVTNFLTIQMKHSTLELLYFSCF